MLYISQLQPDCFKPNIWLDVQYMVSVLVAVEVLVM